MLATRLYTLLKGQLVGRDGFNNKYYQEKFLLRQPRNRKPRRWVIYKGFEEASKVSAEWHGWLHGTVDKTKMETGISSHEWEKPHKPNLTATRYAYRPPSQKLRDSFAGASHYQAWKP